MSRRRRPAAPVRIVQPKLLPGDVRWVPPHSYDCTGGHHVQAERPVCRCPAYVLGQPCTGTLRPVGKGSRRAVAA